MHVCMHGFIIIIFFKDILCSVSIEPTQFYTSGPWCYTAVTIKVYFHQNFIIMRLEN